MGAVSGGPAIYRDCRIPEPGIIVDAEFFRSTVKLFMQAPSIDGTGKKFTETYYIKGVLRPTKAVIKSPDPEPTSVPAVAHSDAKDKPVTSAERSTASATVQALDAAKSSRLAFEVSHEIRDRTDFGLQLQASMAESKELQFPRDVSPTTRLSTENASNCLIVTTPDGAEIDVDGVKIGQSPLFFSLLSRGSSARVVTVIKPGYVAITKSYRPDGKDLRINLDLNREQQKFKVWPPEAQQ